MKTKDEILKQSYLTANDVKKIIPELGIEKCREIIKEARIEMKNKNFYIPSSKAYLALTSIVKKKLGI